MVPPSFRTAVESGDAEAVLSCLAEDILFNSPVVFTPYRGREAVAPLLAAAVDVFQDFRYTGQVTEGERHVLVFEARVGDRRVQGVDVLRLDEEGLVAELTVMLRPMSAVLAMAEAMRQRLATA
ncbi:MAG: nuclear transport factor 2 family protein [Candidatus Dormibacteria bacterium]